MPMALPDANAVSHQNWVSEARRIHSVKAKEGWRKTHRSFSSWLRDEATVLGVRPSVLWRNLGALEFYSSLGREFEGLRLPAIATSKSTIAPQHLEIIEKLSRTADRAVIRELLRLALEGKLTRRELQNQWRVYKKTIGLHPRRGRGVSQKDRATRTSDQSEWRPAQAEAQAIIDLIRSAPEWIGASSPDLCRAVASPRLSHGPRKQLADIVALVRSEVSEPVSVHGIEVKAAPALLTRDGLRHVVDQIATHRQLFDYCWLAVVVDHPLDNAASNRVKAALPARIGILEVCGAKPRALRHAQRNREANSTQVLAELLNDVMSR